MAGGGPSYGFWGGDGAGSLGQNSAFNMGSDSGGGGGGGGAGLMAGGPVGMILAIVGAASTAIGSFYEAKSAQYKLKSEALSLEYQQSVSNMNARAAEEQAQQILEAGQKQIGQYTMRAGAEKASQEASLAARGIQAGVGSAAEHVASSDIIKEIDTMTINVNAVRAANAARMQAVNYRNQGAFAGLSARSARSSARTINPGATGFHAGASYLLGTARQVSGRWDHYSSSRGGY